MNSNQKRCTRCLEDKLCTEFSKNSKSKDRLQPLCKACASLAYKKYGLSRIRDPQYGMQYYQDNREHLLEAAKVHRENNPNYIIQYRQEHRESSIALMQKYHEENQEHEVEYREKHKPRRNMLLKQRRTEDVSFRLQSHLRSRLTSALRGRHKVGSFIRDLDCTVDFLQKYIESKFYPNPETDEPMTWKNWGSGLNKWQIHHIIPLYTVVLTEREEFLKVCHYTNLKPLWLTDHLEIHHG